MAKKLIFGVSIASIFLFMTCTSYGVGGVYTSNDQDELCGYIF